MKKLTSLKILMLMSLAVGSSGIYGLSQNYETAYTWGGYDFPDGIKVMKAEDAYRDQSVAAELRANDIEDATDEVMADLAQRSPGVVEKIVRNERNLDANYGDIKRFLGDLNDQIDELAEQDSAKDTEIARLAVELADAQAMFAKYVARERSRDKRNNGHEKRIKDLLVSAQRNLKVINQKALDKLNVFGKAVSKYTNRAKKTVVKSLPKVKRLVAGPTEEVVVQSSGGGMGSGQLGSRLQSLRGSSGGSSN